MKITADEIERGIAIDFGKHVAAVWEDREPLGVLGGGDLAMHHLGGMPEIIELGKLMESRPVFSLRVPRVRKSCRVSFAGDVVLSSEDRGVVENFNRRDSDALVVNLEGIPSLHEPEEKRRYDFRFPPERLKWLKSCGVDAVSLANNHAADAGLEGIIEGMAALKMAGIAVFGAGRNEREACQPWRTVRKGIPMAFFGVSYFDVGAAGPEQAGVAVLPHHREILQQEFLNARTRGERIIIMVHGGTEYDALVDDDQREWARWLVARGASLVVGSHPHVIQRDEFLAGALIVHSLGNAVYPRALKGADSGAVRVLEIGID